MNDEKRNDVSNKLMDAAKCISKDDVACVLNDALHGEKKLSVINENCYTCCSASLVELADLVKPSCDRDALLALADEFESGAGAARAHKWSEPANAAMAIALADEYEANAHRIREALGVER